MTDNWIWLCDEAYQVVNMTSNTFQIESNTACASIYKLRCMASKIFSVQAKVRRQLFRKDYQLKTVTIQGFIHTVRLVFQTYLWSSVCAYKQNYMLHLSSFADSISLFCRILVSMRSNQFFWTFVDEIASVDIMTSYVFLCIGI